MKSDATPGRCPRRPLTATEQALVAENIGLIYAMAQKCHYLPPEDAIDVCQMALLRAAQAYDPNYGVRFSTYACNAMKKEMWRFAAQRKLANQRPHRVSRGEFVWTEAAAAPVSDRAEVRESLQIAIRALSERERLALTELVGLETPVNEVSAMLGVTRQRTREIRMSAIAKCRAALGIGNPAESDNASEAIPA